MTLPDGLKEIQKLEKGKKLHTALSQGLVKLYAYSSDGDGIRHAMLDEPDIREEDAKYFLVICSAFVNYFKTFI